MTVAYTTTRDMTFERAGAYVRSADGAGTVRGPPT